MNQKSTVIAMYSQDTGLAHVPSVKRSPTATRMSGTTHFATSIPLDMLTGRENKEEEKET